LQVARIKVDYMKYDEMHALVQKHGFERVTQPAAEETSSSSAATAADSAAKAAIGTLSPAALSLGEGECALVQRYGLA
jgi:hypothetical protein